MNFSNRVNYTNMRLINVSIWQV